ncbi:MAG TPA: hypothetical protein VN903_11085, partial [Polyangia bacterium]|nr:hypothetical protein [Polyangia bacterium]
MLGGAGLRHVQLEVGWGGDGRELGEQFVDLALGQAVRFQRGAIQTRTLTLQSDATTDLIAFAVDA